MTAEEFLDTIPECLRLGDGRSEIIRFNAKAPVAVEVTVTWKRAPKSKEERFRLLRALLRSHGGGESGETPDFKWSIRISAFPLIEHLEDIPEQL
jgi:hypothetical protein